MSLYYCRNLNLGVVTKAKGLQGCRPRRSLGVTSHTLGSVRKCEGVNPHTPKATPTLGDGVPMDSQNFRERFQGSKLNGLWRFLYHWKVLEKRFRDSHSGVPRKKNHLDVGTVERCRVYYKGEGGGFPQVWAMVSLVCLRYPWWVLALKVLQLCTNHLVWVVCRPMWVSEVCQLFLVPSRSSNKPLYPSKCCELRSVPRLLPLPLSYTWTHFWILQRVGSVSIMLHVT